MRGVTVYFVSLGGKEEFTEGREGGREGGRLVWPHHVIEDNLTRPAQASRVHQSVFGPSQLATIFINIMINHPNNFGYYNT